MKTAPGSPRPGRETAARPPAPASGTVSPGDQPIAPNAAARPAPLAQPAEPRQRWRLVYRRSSDAPPASQRDDLAAWETALAASGLPLVGLDAPRSRPRLMFGLSPAVGIGAEHELADVYLTRKVTIGALRSALASRLPAGCELVHLYDVWLGVPSLPALVVAADYRIRLDPVSPDAWEVASAANRLLARESIERQRPKGTGQVRYDLRPLLGGIEVIAPGPPVVLRIQTRVDPQLGAGRPEEVLSALGDVIGRPCVSAETVRERLILAGGD